MCFIWSTENLKFAVREAGRVQGYLLNFLWDCVTLVNDLWRRCRLRGYVGGTRM